MCRSHDTDVTRIKTDTGERGWVPSWYIGKNQSSESALSLTGGESQPTSAATPIQRSNSGGTDDGEDIIDGYSI